MKISSSIISLLLVASVYFASAQNFSSPTVRQVFSLEQGDSLEYHEWTVSQTCGTICNWYELKTVDSINYSDAQDTMFIFFQNLVMRFDSGAPVNPCGPCSQEFMLGDICPISAVKWSLTDLDSSIVYFLDTTYRTHFGTVRDSCYSNAAYNGIKQLFYSYDRFESFNTLTQDIYVDSIGIVYKDETEETPVNNIEQLIYYHKANGKVWGTPYIVSDVGGVTNRESISVYPNPADDRFIIMSDTYSGMHFRLFDALSKEVMHFALVGNETEVSRNNLPGGMYFWQIGNGGDVSNTGKLVIK